MTVARGFAASDGGWICTGDPFGSGYTCHIVGDGSGGPGDPSHGGSQATAPTGAPGGYSGSYGNGDSPPANPSGQPCSVGGSGIYNCGPFEVTAPPTPAGDYFPDHPPGAPSYGGYNSASGRGPFIGGGGATAVMYSRPINGAVGSLPEEYRKPLEEAIVAAAKSKRIYYNSLYNKSYAAYRQVIPGLANMPDAGVRLWHYRIDYALRVMATKNFSDLMVNSYIGGINDALGAGLKAFLPGKIGRIITGYKAGHSFGSWFSGPPDPEVGIICGPAVGSICAWYLENDWP